MQFLRKYAPVLAPVVGLVCFVAARLWLTAASHDTSVPSANAVGTLASQFRPAPQLVTSEMRSSLLAGPLQAAQAERLASDLTRRLVVEHGSIAMDIEFRDVFHTEVVNLLQSPHADLRAAIARYLADPYGDDALKGFEAGGKDWAALRRFAILGQPVRPLVALEAYFKANDLKADPFLQIQAINLSAAIGDLATARTIQTQATRRWTGDRKIQAILLAKSGMLDLMTGSWGTWQDKYVRALELNLAIGRWEGAASNALVLGDISNRRLYEEGEIGGGDVNEAAPFLRQGLELATRAKAYDLVADAYLSLANLTLVGDERIGISINEASAMRDKALDASLRHGDIGAYLRMASNVILIETQGMAFDHAEQLARAMQSVAEEHGAPWGVADALTLRFDIALERGRMEEAVRLLGEADGYAAFLTNSYRGNLELAHARLENTRGKTAKGCHHVRKAGDLYQQDNFAEGVSYAEEYLRQYGCGR